MRSKMFLFYFRRLNVSFFRRSKVSIIFDNFDHEIETSIMRSKV